MRMFRLFVPVVLVVGVLAGCGDDSDDDSDEPELEEPALDPEDADGLIDDFIGETLYRIPEERDRLVQQAEDDGEDIERAHLRVEVFMELGPVRDRVDEIRAEFEESGEHLPDIDPQD